MNKYQKGYFNFASGVSILYLILLGVLAIFKETREYIFVVLILFVAMWMITGIHLFLFSGDEKEIDAMQEK